MLKAEGVARRAVEAAPVGGGDLQQRGGADHIGLDEGRRAVDRAVDVRLCGEVHDRIGAERAEEPFQRGAVADVGLREAVAHMRVNVTQRGEVTRVGERIQGQNLML